MLGLKGVHAYERFDCTGNARMVRRNSLEHKEQLQKSPLDLKLLDATTSRSQN